MTPAMNSCAIDTFGADAVDDHDDRRRDQQAERAGAGERADRDVLGIAARAASSGSVILPIVAHVAADEPDTAAKIVQPMMFVCSSRPGSALEPRREALEHVFGRAACETGSRPSTRRAAARSASSDDAEPQIVDGMTSSIGATAKSSMPIEARRRAARPHPDAAAEQDAGAPQRGLGCREAGPFTVLLGEWPRVPSAACS